MMDRGRATTPHRGGTVRPSRRSLDAGRRRKAAGPHGRRLSSRLRPAHRRRHSRACRSTLRRKDPRGKPAYDHAIVGATGGHCRFVEREAGDRSGRARIVLLLLCLALVLTAGFGVSSGASDVAPPALRINSRLAPSSAAQGSRYRLSGPISSRRRCGTTMPTKAMPPLTATAAPVAAETIRIATCFSRCTGTPRWAANPPRQHSCRIRLGARKGVTSEGGDHDRTRGENLRPGRPGERAQRPKVRSRNCRSSARRSPDR